MPTKQQKAATVLDDSTEHSGNPTDDGEGVQAGRNRPIWETVAAIGAEIPEETWDTIPDDASINYKHYLYGVPKKQQ